MAINIDFIVIQKTLSNQHYNLIIHCQLKHFQAAQLLSINPLIFRNMTKSTLVSKCTSSGPPVVALCITTLHKWPF